MDRKTITSEGVKKIQPVSDRYARLCQEMLKDVAAEVRQIVLKTNELLMAKARWGV